MSGGVDGEVRVSTDGKGVPTVHGPDRVAVARGLGWVTARDRLFQLDLFRRRATGRLAEVFGPGLLAHDTAQRTLGIRIAAERALRDLPPGQRALVEAYTRGVNERLATLPDLPVEFAVTGGAPEPWHPGDCTAVALLLAQMLGGDGAEHRMRAVMEAALPAGVVSFLLPEQGPYDVGIDGRPAPPPQPPDPALLATLAGIARDTRPDPGAAPVVGADESPFGSNAWAVSGRRTADGRAVLANDMHLPLTAPPLLYRVSLRYPGHEVDGLVVPGVPAVIAGSTGRIAWGATRLTADNARLVPLGDDEPLTVRTERIEVRGGEPVEVRVQESRFGPVYGPALLGRPVALRWRPLEPGGLDLGLADLAEAGTAEEACDVANRAAGPPLNIVVADAHGRVAWTVTGSFPGAARLPRLVDPPGGLVVVANNLTPQHAAAAHVAANGFSACRARRIVTLLETGAPLAEADLAAVQLDTDAGFFAFYRDLVRAAAGDAGDTPPALRDALDAVEAWDGTAGAGARGLGLLILLRENLRESLFAALLQPCRALDPRFRYTWFDHELPLRALLRSEPAVVPAPYRTRARFVLGQLELSAAMLRVAAGPATAPARVADVTWGALNRTGARHPLSPLLPDLAAMLDLPDAALPGCAESVHAAHTGFGPAMRLVASPGRPGDAILHLPGGQSGDPRHPNYADQFDDWLRGRPAPLLPGEPRDDVVLAHLQEAR
ncbi:penicillin acylase family protein [Dactylosporangium sp. CA-052675]|uniref:penicillin acylase family protein n=1 Tax=Dactylosporangium sp. CA-052675 TaxID=3239927 RepID=UPI003D8DC857